MERLSELPPKSDTVKTPEESEIMNQLFPGKLPPQGMPPQGMPPQGMPPQGMPPQGMPPQGMPVDNFQGKDSRTSRINWKMVAITTILFLVLANPWVDIVFCKIPYCDDNSIMLLSIKTLIFLLMMVIVNLFV